MALIEHYGRPIALHGRTAGDLTAQLTANMPLLFSGDAPGQYIAFCLLGPNLEPLDEETIHPADMAPERLPAKFTIAMHNQNFSWCRLEHCLVFVLSISVKRVTGENPDIEQYSTEIGNFLSIVEADFGISLTATVSAPFNSPEECEGAVRDALVMVDFSCFIESRVDVVDSLYYDGMKRYLSRKHPEYLLVNYERPLIAAVLSHNYLHAELILNKLLIAHLCDPIWVFPSTQMTMFHNCRLVMSMSFIDPREMSDQIPRIEEIFEEMRLCATLSEMQDLIHQFFYLVQDYVKNNDTITPATEKMQRIIGFINENYKNPSFDASMVSDRFDITPQYLSRAFREQVGVNLSTYVQTVRISAAKDLLRNTEMTVERIAAEVGYISGQNLLRLFRKYEGISPTEYKTMVRGIGGEETIPKSRDQS